MKKIIIIGLFAASFSQVLLAADGAKVTNNWRNNETMNISQDHYLLASIGFSNDGEQRLYFDYGSFDSALPEPGKGDACTPSKFEELDDNSKIATSRSANNVALVKVNGVNVKMLQWWCKQREVIQLTDSKKGNLVHWYQSWTPYTPMGANYIISAIKRSSDYVKFSYDGIEFKVGAVGFSKAWNSRGGDAI